VSALLICLKVFFCFSPQPMGSHLPPLCGFIKRFCQERVIGNPDLQKAVAPRNSLICGT
jgi:hypothetical protein